MCAQVQDNGIGLALLGTRPARAPATPPAPGSAKHSVNIQSTFSHCLRGQRVATRSVALHPRATAPPTQPDQRRPADTDPPPLPSRTNWTRLVPRPVLTGHVPLIPTPRAAHPRRRQRLRGRCAERVPRQPPRSLARRQRSWRGALPRQHPRPWPRAPPPPPPPLPTLAPTHVPTVHSLC